jgi:hypothetical protein
MGDGTFRGSGRSPEWYPALTRMGAFCHAAGHEYAFGVSFSSVEELVAWYRFVVADVASVREEAVKAGGISFDSGFDLVINDDNGNSCTELDEEFLNDFLECSSGFHPFGHGFPAPRVMVGFDLVNRQSRRTEDFEDFVVTRRGMKPNGDGGYLHGKFELPGGLTLLCFNQGDDVLGARPGHHRVSGRLGINVWRGTRTLEVIGMLDG